VSFIIQSGEERENKMGRKVLAFHYVEIFPQGGPISSFWLFLMYYPESPFRHKPFVVKGQTIQSFDNLTDAATFYEAELEGARVRTQETLA
jgi:hypothetical protein